MYSEIARNKTRSWVIILAFIAFVGTLGWFFGQYAGSWALTFGVLIGASVYALVMYFAGSRVALAVNGAREIQKRDNPRLYRIVENLAITEGLPMPKVYIMDDPAPNAFATGRNPQHAAVCATTGILEIMDDDELEGVFAHEMGHVKNYDIRVSMIAAALAVVVGFIADALMHVTWFGGNDDDEGGSNPLLMILAVAGAVLAPLVATLIQLAITRRREYLADATGALATRYPEGLARALEKIAAYGSATRRQNTSTAHLFFANPLRGRGLANLFSTHPPIEERIKRLREMGSHA
ncbi:MAG TPA: M48 family metalloprotease [Candidatus Saccharimonadales bacterium]|nr:M48 family metalloprotease [Candidatus Saccharimonadales bacterium]